MKRLVLIDSHAIIHRAYHALPPLTTPLGDPINAVYGFATILLRILRELKPDYIAAAFDLPGPTFRHIAYERYKAQRPETPSDLASQFTHTRELLLAFGIPVLQKEGYEADDILGTVARKAARQKKFETFVVTGDMDALQLVGPRLKVYTMKKIVSETAIYDEQAVYERYGLKPAQLVDFKGLKGDPSDNIKGVKGIGEKTAQELLKKFGTVEGVYKALRKGSNEISGSVAAKLREGEKDAKLSKELATIKTNVPVKFKIEDFLRKNSFDELPEKARVLFQKFGFSSLLKRFSPSLPAEEKEQARLGIGGEIVPRQSIEGINSKEFLKRFLSECAGKNTGLIVEDNELFVVLEGGKGVFKIAKGVFSYPEAGLFFEKTPSFFVFDGKAVLRFLRSFGIRPAIFVFDMALASYVAGAVGRDFSYLGVESRELGILVSSDPRAEFSRFFEACRTLEKKLEVGRLKKIFQEIEMPLTSILVSMEERGVLLDKRVVAELSSEVSQAFGKLTQNIHKLAGQEFNINSSQQLSLVLFEKLKIKTHGLRKTDKGGVVSTGASELEKLRDVHPIIGKVLEYRELAKLKNTYIDTLPSMVNSKTGRLHTTFNQTGTATGRLSSSGPNLQNIPILSEYGRKIRKAFVAENGFVLVSFDYSQIELRVAAHLADDEKMIRAFKKGLDVHKITASEIYNVPLDKVTPDLRRAAKTLNFGVLYGMGAQAFAENTGFSKKEAKKFIDEYFHDFSGVREYLENTKRLAAENGYVETMFGRRRYIPEIYSPNWQLKREAERMAINAPIQGSAADLVKLAMIRVFDWIKKERLEKNVRMLLQVHDELVFEIKKEVAQKAIPKVRAVMESVAALKVPLVVDVKTGPNWGEQTLWTF